jgi:hypothetical protein
VGKQAAETGMTTRFNKLKSEMPNPQINQIFWSHPAKTVSDQCIFINIREFANKAKVVNGDIGLTIIQLFLI